MDFSLAAPVSILVFVLAISATTANQVYVTYISTGWYGTSHQALIRLHGYHGSLTFGLNSHGFPVRSTRRFNLNGRDIGTITSVEIQEIRGPSIPAWNIRQVMVRVGRKIYQFPFKNGITSSGWVRITMNCPKGFQHNQQGACVDINECARAASPCYGPHVTCRNTIGSYKCECPSGFYLSGDRCMDIDECSNVGKMCQHQCLNTVGSYRCQCHVGYKLVDGYKCQDINECVENNPCDAVSTTCSNHVGYYQCECKPGYQRETINKCKVSYCDASTDAGANAVLSPSRCGQSQQNHYKDKCRKICNHGYVPQNAGAMTLTCNGKGTWEGKLGPCVGIFCPALSPILNGQYTYNDRCTTTGGQYGSIVDSNCNMDCNKGYRRVGERDNHCQADGTWSGTPITCKRIPPYPVIDCPKYLEVTLAKGQSEMALGDKWKEPTSNVEKVTLIKPVGANRLYRFPAGRTNVEWRAVNEDGKAETCTWTVNVMDKEAPVSTYCPGPKMFYPTHEKSGFVPYKKPTFTDNVAVTKVTPAYSGGYRFSDFGSHQKRVHYTARDDTGNHGNCIFHIWIGGTKCRVPPEDSHLRGSWIDMNVHVKIFRRVCPAGLVYSGRLFVRTCRESDGKWGFPTAGVAYGDPVADCVPTVVVKQPAACPPNYVRGPINDTCYACARGTYQTGGKCEKCAAGTFQSKDAQDSCDKCPSGTSSLEGAFECRALCPAGTYSSDGMRPFCHLCPSGQHQSAAGSKTCVPCAGTTNTKYGATACVAQADDECSEEPFDDPASTPLSPVIERIVSPENVTERADNTLECYLKQSKYSPLSVTWKIEGNVPAEFLGVPKLTELTNSSGQPNGARLVIRQATQHNADMRYVCEATNPNGITRKVVTLKWNH